MSDIWNSVTGIFGSTPVPGGATIPDPNQTGGSVSTFFSNMLTGAERGAAQAFAGSQPGQQLQGFLTQGQSQLFASNVFGNPAILLAVLGLSAFALITLARKA